MSSAERNLSRLPPQESILFDLTKPLEAALSLVKSIVRAFLKGPFNDFDLPSQRWTKCSLLLLGHVGRKILQHCLYAVQGAQLPHQDVF